MLRISVVNEDFNFPDTSIPSAAETRQSRIRACLAIENLLNPVTNIETESGEDSSDESEISIHDLGEAYDGKLYPKTMAAEEEEDATTLDEMDINGLGGNDVSSDSDRKDLDMSDAEMSDVRCPGHVVVAPNIDSQSDSFPAHGNQHVTTEANKPPVHLPTTSFLRQSSNKRPYIPSLRDTSPDARGPAKKMRKDAQGTSKSALASRTLRESFRSGKLEMNEKKVANWKQKCRTKDPDVEFDKQNISARHSKCGEFVKMKEPYDATRFNEHVKRCTPESRKKRAAAGSSSLWKWIGKTRDNPSSLGSTQTRTRTAVLDAELNYPCPGLTELDDPRVPKYLRRTGFAGGGARALTDIAKNRFGKAFSELGKQKKQEVVDVQLHEHKWRNDHQKLRVFASKCKQHVAKPVLNCRAQPCDECSALLSNKRFKAILRKPTPDDKDFIYTNHRYRSKNLGEIYARTIGLRQIIENPVRSYFFLRNFRCRCLSFVM